MLRGLRLVRRGRGPWRGEEDFGVALRLLPATGVAERSHLCPQGIAFCLSFSNIKVYF